MSRTVNILPGALSIPQAPISVFGGKPRKTVTHDLPRLLAYPLLAAGEETSIAMQALLTSPYWSTKLRILILAAATFAALC